MTLRPTPPLTVRRRMWSERSEKSDETQSLLDNAEPLGSAPHSSPSSSLSSEHSVHSDSEGHVVLWNLLQLLFGRSEGKKKKDSDLSPTLKIRLFGKPQCTKLKCRNCKEYENVTQSFSNVEDFMCIKCREAVKEAEGSGVVVCQMCQCLMYASTQNESLDPSLPLCPQCLGDTSAHPVVPMSSAMMTPASFEAYVQEAQ